MTTSSAFQTVSPPSLVQEEPYEQWRRGFMSERLVVLYYLGLIANPVFMAADWLLYRAHFAALLEIRAILETGLFLAFLGARWQLRIARPEVLLVFWIVFPNICVVHMTMVLGGFASSYYNGLNLVFLAAAVIVPVSWRSHLAAQLSTLLYYYGANWSFRSDQVALNAAIENSFFLIWTCIALLFSVYFYDRLQRAEYQARLSERRIRQELETSNRKLLELDRLKSEFFANISHELRTPLTLILGAYKSLLRFSPTAECEAVIQAGLRNAGRLLFLINELLDLARFESGRAELRKTSVDLCAVIRNVAANFESSERQRVHVHGVTQPILVELDPRQMKKVLYNLLSNAFKFSDPEKGEAWISVKSRGTEVEIEVEDNGIGIPADQLHRIFDRFTQVEGAATRRYEGSGIGLALVKEIVTLHGGRVTADSEVAKGTTFTILLPRGHPTATDLALSDEDEALIPSSTPQTELSPTQRVNKDASQRGETPLLVVADDNADMRAYLERVLSGSYEVVLARDGVEALQHVRAFSPALVLTDVMMPQMSGMDLLKAMRQDPVLRLTPVIFLTARAGADAHAESLDAGADDYVAKPFDEQELLARVQNAIRARVQERELASLQRQRMARFLPQHVAELVLSEGGQELLKGHRAEITVVFIDLRGFTAFAETAEPEELVSVLREYQREIGHVITTYNGTLERFAGDSMMIFFNDPLPVQDHPAQAVRMALAMRDRVAALRTRWTQRGIDLGAGIGLATGFATLGLVGFEERHDYAAIGTVTNLAARLCAEAQHGQVLVSNRFLELVRPLVHSESVGELKLKGFHRPVSVYNVTSLNALPSILQDSHPHV